MCHPPACAFEFANGLVNPIVHGLSGLTGGEVFRWFEEIHHTRPAGKWLVLGNSSRGNALAHLIKATGADVLGGTVNPDAAMVPVLIPMAATPTYTIAMQQSTLHQARAANRHFNSRS